MSEKQSAPVGVGVITIVTVLLVLCLTIFATLTLASARADRNLSQINADTVSAYYAADQTAVGLAADFAAGTAAALEETLSITDTQSLYIHLVRDAGGNIHTLAWRSVPVEVSTDLGSEGLPVWDGTLPAN